MPGMPQSGDYVQVNSETQEEMYHKLALMGFQYCDLGAPDS